jgi:hypothetical protein
MPQRPLTPSQLATRRRVERLIGLIAPALDAVLFAGEQLSKVAGRNELPDATPEGRINTAQRRTRIGGPPSP